jgi:hypothetical protein
MNVKQKIYSKYSLLWFSAATILFIAEFSLADIKVTIFVSQQTGSDSNSGLSTESAVATIGKGIEVLKEKEADILIVGPGTYYERPLINSLGSSEFKKIWIRAEPRGEAIISGMWREAADGLVEWRDEGNNIWSAEHASSFMGSFKNQFLFHYNSLVELTADSVAGVIKPLYGFTTQYGNLYLQLPPGENPNGECVMFTENFGQAVIEIRQSPYVILDGFVIEGGGNGDDEGHAVMLDKNSHHVLYRNLIFRYCRRCVQLSDYGVAEWCEYTYPNFYNFVEDLCVLNNGQTGGIYTLVKKVFSSNGNAYYEGAFAVSFRDEPSEHVEVHYCYFHETFDAENLGQFNHSSSHHNVYNYNYDDNNELECWKHNTHHGINLRVHDNLMLNCMAGPMSHQDVGGDKLFGPHYVYRNVIYITDSDHSHPAFIIKNKNGHEDLEIYYYHNILMNIQGENQGWGQTNWLFWNNQHRDALHFYNNILSLDNCTNTDISPAIDTDYNILVNNKDMLWLRGENGLYVGTSEDTISFLDKANLNFGIRSGSPAENAGTVLPAEWPDSDHPVQSMPDIGPFEVGENPGQEWPRPRRTVFNENPPEGFENATSIKAPAAGYPQGSFLLKNYPNPFNSMTIVKFQLSRQSKVKIDIYDIQGRFVGELVNNNFQLGFHEYTWDARNLSSGFYFIQLKTQYNREIFKSIIIN